VAFGRTIEKFEARHRWTFVLLTMAVVSFVVVILMTGNHLGAVYGTKLQQLEESSSP
jgi:hypothetical protein